ncbi:MAG: glutamate--tRNA ligase [Bacilli bacterium]|nr:glutamate--tRNA ligase [Bacilli bacterium]
MVTYKDLAQYIFSDINETIEDLEKKYPPRNLSCDAEVTRFAPSPTGFLHLGSLFMSLVASKVAYDSNGVFYVRLEDTDTKREIEGSGEELIEQLSHFGIVPDEGYLGSEEKGDYGPYTQSKRAHIYRVCIKHLMEQGRAYPCFCSHEQIEEIRQVQEAMKVIPGYYGEYALCRNITPEEALKRIKAGEKYVIRFRSQGNFSNKVTFHDLIRGDIQIADNALDVVIMKSDGLPTYHFAHACDDHFMRTTTVLRGEEWIASAPIHLELFKALGFDLPKYAHAPVIMKLDNGNKRKLSKRKDPEASVSHFIMEGFPKEALKAYLMSIANSNFEEWTITNKCFDINKFKFSFEKMSLDGVLFDQDKLNYFSKEIIAQFSAEDFYNRLVEWSKLYDETLYTHIKGNKEYVTKILNIERGGEKARKDFTFYKEVYPIIGFFFNDRYDQIVKDGYPFNEVMSKEVIKNVLTDFASSNDYSLPNDLWFNSLKELAVRHNFADSNKTYKANKDIYLGHVGDVAEMVRVALVGAKNSPNLHSVIQILGKEEVDKRINKAIDYLA